MCFVLCPAHMTFKGEPPALFCVTLDRELIVLTDILMSGDQHPFKSHEAPFHVGPTIQGPENRPFPISETASLAFPPP